MRGIAGLVLGVTAGLVPLVLVGMPNPASAAPVIAVKAKTDIVLLPVVRQRGGRVQIRGKVIDQLTGMPVPDVRVAVTVQDITKSGITTDEDGVFSASFVGLEDGIRQVGVRHTGSDYTTESQASRQVDIQKQSLRLSARVAPDQITEEAVAVTVEAITAGAGIEVTLDYTAGPVETPRSNRGTANVATGQVTTDSSGRGQFSVSRQALGGPGRKRIAVRLPGGDPSFNPAETHVDVLLSSATETSLDITAETVSFEGELAIRGRVIDDTGTGIVNGPVVLRVGNRRLASGLTDGEGDFDFALPGAEIGTGKFHVQAVFEPTRPWYRKSRSEVYQVEVAEPQPVPVTHTLAAFGATALAVMAFFGLRTRPWESWLAHLRRARDPRPASKKGPDAVPAVVQGGLQQARPGLMSSLRRAQEFHFSGAVYDAVTQRTVAGAVVVLSLPQETAWAPSNAAGANAAGANAAGANAAGARAEEICDRRGQFRFDSLTAGAWHAEVAAPGYVTERFTATIPHRGELTDARVDLVPVRERIFAMYRDVAEPLLPDPDKWGIWSPRQIFDHIRAQKPAQSLAALTDFVEESYFSQRTPEESSLAHAARLAEAAAAETGAELGSDAAR